jgi:hypothetical protein
MMPPIAISLKEDKRQMTGRLWKLGALIAICLALGALATIAVAWHFARWPDESSHAPSTYWSHNGTRAWLYRRSDSATATRLEGTPTTAWASSNSVIVAVPPPSWSEMSEPPAPSNQNGQPARVMDEAFGWPMRSMRCWYSQNPNATGRWRSYIAHDAIELGVRHPYEQNRFLALPLRPIWPGFIAGTLIWGVASLPLVLLSLAAIRFVITARSRWRRRRGRCPFCNYQLQNALEEGCPECGWNRTASTADV